MKYRYDFSFLLLSLSTNPVCLFCFCRVVSWYLYFSFKMTVLSTFCRINTLSSLINKSSVIKLFRSDQNAFKQGCKFCQIKYICYDLVITAWPPWINLSGLFLILFFLSLIYQNIAQWIIYVFIESCLYAF